MFGCGEMNALDAPSGDIGVDGIGGVAGVREDLFDAMAQPLGAVDDDRQAVGLMAGRRPALTATNSRLGIGRDLRAEDQMRAVAGL